MLTKVNDIFPHLRKVIASTQAIRAVRHTGREVAYDMSENPARSNEYKAAEFLTPISDSVRVSIYAFLRNIRD